MNAVWLAAAAGATVAAGGLLVWYGATRPVDSLATIARAQDRVTIRRQRGGRLFSALTANAQRNFARELELCEESAQRWVSIRLLVATEFAMVPLLVWVLQVVGVLPRLVSGPLLLVAVVAGAAAGWGIAVLQLKNEARQREIDFSDALASYTSLVAILVSGGSGVETAIEDAAKVGQGAAWRHLSTAIDASVARREPPWATLRAVGERLELEDLTEFGASMELAADGSHVVSALEAKAKAIHERDMNRELAAAETKSEAMVVPITLMLTGVFVLIGYPVTLALTRI